MILQGRDRYESLATAIVRIARKMRSARLNAADLWDLVKVHCPKDDRGFWGGPYCSAPQIAGLLRVEGWERVPSGWWGGPVENGTRQVGEMRRLIESEGVLFWDHWSDEEWRIVDATWLTAHQDIRDWLVRQWLGGHRCRFCAMVENPLVDELKQVQFEPHDHPFTRRFNGALVHDRCKPHFLAWVAIAQQYETPRAAEEADEAAGRQSRYLKVVQASVALEAPA